MAKPNERTRVLIVDDDAMVRVGLRSLLTSNPELELVGEAESASQALSMAAELRPAVMLVDIRMNGQSQGFALARDVTARLAGVRVLILSLHAGAEYVRDAKAAGASGYVLKDDAAARLFDAIRVVALGGQYFPDSPGEPSESDLTPREREILILVAEGLRNREISERLGIAERTVESHRQNVRNKLGIDTAAEFATYADRRGWLED